MFWKYEKEGVTLTDMMHRVQEVWDRNEIQASQAVVEAIHEELKKMQGEELLPHLADFQYVKEKKKVKIWLLF